ncbi:MAG: PH domain-containing protein [Lactobacillaceae bacterium]|jgi:uncharacterized membrane protein YdbT with pleckstrin-like domain|nr:PH domain-containing protein [Lactobacillaceae bacterium]
MQQSWKFFIIRGVSLLYSFIWGIPAIKFLEGLTHWPVVFRVSFLIWVGIELLRVVLEYKGTHYYIKPEKVVLEYGAFSIKAIEMDADNQQISNVRIRQGWLQRLLKIEGLIIYLQNGEESENITLYALPPAEVKRIMAAFEFKLSAEAVPDKAAGGHVLNRKTILLSALFSANYLLVIPFILDAKEFLAYVPVVKRVDFANYSLLVMGIAAGLFIICWTIVIQFHKFGNFRLTHRPNEFLIRNGWVDSDENVVLKENIRGLKISATLGQRLLGINSVSIMQKNANQEQTRASNYVFPLIKCAATPLLIEQYLPTFSAGYQQAIKAPRQKGHVARWLYLSAIVGEVAVLMGMINHFYSVLDHQLTWGLGIIIVVPLFFRTFFTRIIVTEGYYIVQQGLLNKHTYVIPNAAVGVTQRTVLHLPVRLTIQRIMTETNPAEIFKCVE